MEKYDFLTKNGLAAILSPSLENRSEEDDKVVTHLLDLNNSNNNGDVRSTTTRTTITEKTNIDSNDDDIEIEIDDEDGEQELVEMESYSNDINTGLEFAGSLESLCASMESISIPDPSHSYFITGYNQILSNTFPGYSNSKLSYSLEDTAESINKGDDDSVKKKDSVIKKAIDWLVNLFKKIKEVFVKFFNSFKKFLSKCLDQTNFLIPIVESIQKKIDKYKNIKSFVFKEKKITIKESVVKLFKYDGEVMLYDWNKLKTAEENTLEVVKGAVQTITPSFRVRQDGISQLIKYIGASEHPTLLDKLSEMAPKYFHFHTKLNLPNSKRYPQSQLNLGIDGWSNIANKWMKDYYEPEVLVTPLLNNGYIGILYPKRDKRYFPDDESPAQTAQLASPRLAIGDLTRFVKSKSTGLKVKGEKEKFDLLELNKLTEINGYSFELLRYIKELKSTDLDSVVKSIEKMDPLDGNDILRSWMDQSKTDINYSRARKDSFLIHGLIEGTSSFARVFSVLIRYILTVVKANCRLVKCHLSEYSDIVKVK